MASKKSDPLNRPVVQLSNNEVERALESFPSSTKPFDTRLDKRLSRYGSQFNFGALDIAKAVEIYPELAGGDTAIENNKGGTPQATPSKIESAPVTKSGSRKSHQPSELTLKRLKLAAYRFLCRHEEVRLWLQDVFSISIGADLIDRLKSGVMLCELINQIQDKLIPKINKKTSIAYFAMENIELFLRACAQLGVMRDHLFMPTDLYEEKNLPKVINCLVQLEEAARKKGFAKHIQPINELSMDFTEVQLTKASELVMIAEGFDEENKPSVDISIEEVRNLIKLEKMEELEKNGKTQLLAELVAEVDSEPSFEKSLERVEEEHRTLTRDEEPVPEVKVETLEEKESSTETTLVEKVEEVVKEEAVQVEAPKVEVEETKEVQEQVVEPPKEPEPQPVEEKTPEKEPEVEPPKEPEVVPTPVVEEPKPEPPVESPKVLEPPKEEEPLDEPEIINMEKVEITELDGQRFKPDKGDKVDEMLARWLQEKKFGKQIKKIAWGKYMFGNMKLTVRDINGCLMVRVGGGWMKLDDFIKKNQHLLFKESKSESSVESKNGKSTSVRSTRSSSFLDHLTAPLSRTPRSRNMTASADSTKSTPIRKVERKPSTLKRPASAPAKPHRRSFSEPSTPKKPPPSFQMHTVSSLMKSPSLPNISTATSSKGSRSTGNPLGKSKSVSSVALTKQKS